MLCDIESMLQACSRVRIRVLREGEAETQDMQNFAPKESEGLR